MAFIIRISWDFWIFHDFFSLWSLNFCPPPSVGCDLSQYWPVTFEIFICPPVWDVILVKVLQRKTYLGSNRKCEGILNMTFYHFKRKRLESINFILIPSDICYFCIRLWVFMNQWLANELQEIKHTTKNIAQEIWDVSFSFSMFWFKMVWSPQKGNCLSSYKRMSKRCFKQSNYF
jgi:hypothetical protein